MLNGLRAWLRKVAQASARDSAVQAKPVPRGPVQVAEKIACNANGIADGGNFLAALKLAQACTASMDPSGSPSRVIPGTQAAFGT